MSQTRCITCYPSRYIKFGSQVAVVVENPSANAGDIRDMGSMPGLGRSPRGGHSNPLQYSCLENLMDRGTWRATVHGGHKKLNMIEQLSKARAKKANKALTKKKENPKPKVGNKTHHDTIRHFNTYTKSQQASKSHCSMSMQVTGREAPRPLSILRGLAMVCW